MNRFPLPTALAALLLLVGLVPSGAFATDPVDHGGFVAEQPLLDTVRLQGNNHGDYVNAISEVDGMVAAGGKFLTARAPGGAAVTATNFAMWNTSDNVPLPAPQFDREVKAIEATADGQGWYVAGIFKHVNGVYRRALVRVNRDGSVDPTFDPVITWRVNDIELVGDVLYVAGDFDKIDGQSFTSLAALDAVTGEPLPGWAPVFADPYDTEDVAAFLYGDHLAANEDGTRLVVAGNFSSIDGQPRGRIAQFDISGATPQLLDWSIAGFGIDQCRRRDTPQFITDIDVADGYVVTVTTGAYGSPTSYRYLCDTLARFELDDRGADVRPTYLSYSGGDTLTQVEVVGDVVYVGGHQRWMNNPFGSDVKRAGAVDRMGISAHNAVNGLPYSWDPGRSPRGWGVFELSPTPAGLWVGQDTDWIGGVYTAFAGFLPHEGGVLPPVPTNGVLPVTLQLPAAGDDLQRSFDGTTGADLPAVPSTIDHTNLNAVTRVGDDVLAVYGDGRFLSYADRGNGPATAVNLRGLDTENRFRANDISSLAWDEVRQELVYSRFGDSRLRARGWNPESGVIGAQARVVDQTINWSSVRGAFIVDGVHYSAQTDGTLRAAPYGWSTVDTSARTVVSGPALDGLTWNASMFVAAAGTTPPPSNQAPTADLFVDCTELDCAVDATGSTDPDGTIVSYAIQADGTAGSPSLDTATGTLTFDQPGDATITLTVTDDDGATGTTSTDVTLTQTPPPTASPELVGVATRNYWGKNHTVVVPAATPDGAVALLQVTAATRSVLPDSPSGDVGGWTLLAEETTGNSQTRVWWAPLDAGDAGDDVDVHVSRGTSTQIGLMVWTGLDTTDPVRAIELESSSGGTTHVSPTVDDDGAATVLELYAMKSDHATDWVPLDGQTPVFETHGSGGAHMSTLLTRRDVSSGTSTGGGGATVDADDRGVTVGTIVLRAG